MGAPQPARVLSVNLRPAPETLRWLDQEVATGINKQPVDGPVRVGHAGLDGDTIVDTRHHGGTYKAVYSYAMEDYDFWRQALGRAIPVGAMGENLTTEGLRETEIHIGDRFQVGSVILQAAEPRQPCRVLGMNFQDMGLVRRFLEAGRFGVYFQVLQPGILQAGDAITRIHRDPAGIPVGEISRLHKRDKDDLPALEAILRVSALPPAGWGLRVRPEVLPWE